MHKDCERILFSAEELHNRIAEIAREVSLYFVDRAPLFVGILKGSFIFCADFIRELTIPVELDFMSVSTYSGGTVSSGELKIKKDLDADVKGRAVVIIEDIIDSGFTISKLIDLLLSRGAALVSIVTLLDKPSRREHSVTPNFSCFTVGNEFVVGYGLDHNEKYRELPYVAVLKREVYEK